jgi:hypothetical protein
VKIAGVSPDLLLAAVVAIASAFTYSDDHILWRALVGLVIGLLAAILVESTQREPPGLTSVIFAISGVVSTIVPGYMERRLSPGRFSKKMRERIMRVQPYVLTLILALSKEALMIVYFYLQGVAITSMHFIRLVLGAGLTFAISAAASAALVSWVMCMPDGTLFAQYLRSRENKRRRKALRGIRRKAAENPAAAIVPATIKAKPIDD